MIDIKDTKRAIEGLLVEFGQTLPTRFEWRILKIVEPYVPIAKVNGIWCSGRSFIFDSIETIAYHSGHGSSVEEVKDELEYFINHIEILDRLSLKE